MSWTCPDCGRTFARTGQTHVCETWTVDDHLDGADERTVDLFRGFAPDTKKLTVHHFRLESPDQLDEEFASFVRESYAIG
jgi:hypothetical protein